MTTAKYNGKKYVVQFLDNEILLYDHISGAYVKTLTTVTGLTEIKDEEISAGYVKHVSEPSD